MALLWDAQQDHSMREEHQQRRAASLTVLLWESRTLQEVVRLAAVSWVHRGEEHQQRQEASLTVLLCESRTDHRGQHPTALLWDAQQDHSMREEHQQRRAAGAWVHSVYHPRGLQPEQIGGGSAVQSEGVLAELHEAACWEP